MVPVATLSPIKCTISIYNSKLVMPENEVSALLCEIELLSDEMCNPHTLLPLKCNFETRTVSAVFRFVQRSSYSTSVRRNRCGYGIPKLGKKKFFQIFFSRINSVNCICNRARSSPNLFD